MIKYVYFLMLAFIVSKQSSTLIKTVEKEPQKFALVISISQFENFTALNTQNDAKKMTDYFKKQGFATIQLVDKTASTDSIKVAFQKLIALTSNNPGTIVAVYISSHGVSIPNNNPKQDPEPDGKDEAIVCYNTRRSLRPDGLIIDDQIGEWFDAIRANIKSKGHLIYFLDACFSNTGVRGDGLDLIKTLSVDNNSSAKTDGNFEVTATLNRKSQLSEDRGKLIAFFAAREDGKARVLSAEKMSVMTLALYNALLSIGKNKSYEYLYEQVKQGVHTALLKTYNRSVDNPIFLFDSLFSRKEKIFAGYMKLNANVLLDSVVVKKVKRLKIQRTELGSSKGTVYSFKRNGRTVVEGVVEKQDELYDWVIPDETKDVEAIGDLETLTAEVEDIDFSGMGTIVALNISDDYLKAQLRTKLVTDKYHFFKVAQKASDASVEVSQKGNYVEIRSLLDNSLVYPKITFSPSKREQALSQTYQLLRNRAVYHLITLLEPESAAPRVSLLFLPARIKRTYNGQLLDKKDSRHRGRDKVELEKIYDTSYFHRKNGLFAIDTSMQAVLRIKNLTNELIYFNLLDINPYQVVSMIWPPPNDNRFNDDTTYRLGPFETKDILLPDFYEPFGLEEFRLLTSKRPINLQNFLEEVNNTKSAETEKKGLTSVMRYYIIPTKFSK